MRYIIMIQAHQEVESVYYGWKATDGDLNRLFPSLELTGLCQYIALAHE